MENFMDLRRFFEEFKNLSLWQRLFAWKTIRVLSYAAWEDFLRVAGQLKERQADADTLRHERDLLSQEKLSFQKQISEARENLLKFESRLQNVDQELKRIEKENQDLHRKAVVSEQKEDQRRREHDQSMQRLHLMQDSLIKERAALEEKKLRDMEERNQQMKETWKRHEDVVQNTVKGICERRAIEYVENVPFKGKPDSVIRICDELIIFDAKSPASDDLTNFNSYIRTQAESLSKYASHESVRKDLYLVVPQNTIEILKKTTFHLGNYNVYVITPDALEPVISSLKQLEEYEFAEQMSPEDRQSICRIVGSYIYLTKRRIQVDQDFNSHALELLAKTSREIPELMHEEIFKQEKAMKINPQADRRAKAISQDVLEKTHAQQEGQARVWEIFEEETSLVVNA